MAKRYDVIWKAIKKGEEVKVKCREEKAATIIQGVKKLKAQENAPRVSLDLPSYGKLQILREKLTDGMMLLTFKRLVLTRAEDL